MKISINKECVKPCWVYIIILAWVIFFLFKIFPHVEEGSLFLMLLDFIGQSILIIFFFEGVRDLYLNDREMKLAKKYWWALFALTLSFSVTVYFVVERRWVTFVKDNE